MSRLFFYIDIASKLQGENRSKKMASIPKCLTIREMAATPGLYPADPERAGLK